MLAGLAAGEGRPVEELAALVLAPQPVVDGQRDEAGVLGSAGAARRERVLRRLIRAATGK